MEFNWILKETPDRDLSKKLSESLGVSEIISDLLVQRSIFTFDEARSYFRPEINGLHDPLLMKDMDKACMRLASAMRNKEKICVYGDYDVDGTTSVAMMYDFLKTHSECEVHHYIPDRYTEGYGVSEVFVESIKTLKYDVVITLDCGIRAVDLITRGKEYGSDFIICDHHSVGKELPPAFAVLDPMRPDCSYPFKGLSGCGVGFKLVQATLKELNLDESLGYQYLDLLTISIGADIVPVDGENRILASFGLKAINESPRPGIKRLLDLAGKAKSTITIGDVVFIIAPRINAAGRIKHALAAVDLLLADSEEESSGICSEIEGYNKERRLVDKEITEAALSKINSDDFYKSSVGTVVWGENWHKGVIGIVASRLIESFYKPTVVLTEKEGMATGSARSIKGIDIHEALEETSDLLTKYGGHKMAAGMSLKSENLETFRERFEEVLSKKIGNRKLVPEVIIDLEIQLSDVTEKAYRILSQFSPFGPKNMTPLFVSRNVVDAGYSKLVGETKDHMKLTLIEQNGGGQFVSGIAFKQGHHYESIKTGQPHDIVYSIELNEWQGRKTVQLNVRDIKKSSV